MRWNLDDLYTSFESREFLEDLAATKREIRDLKEWTEENFVHKDSKYWHADRKLARAAIETYVNRVNNFKLGEKLMAYTNLRRAEDDSDEEAIKYEEKLRLLLANLVETDALFRIFVSVMRNLTYLVRYSELLKPYEEFIMAIWLRKRHLLSTKEEFMMAKMKTTGSSSWANLRNRTIAKMKVEIDIEGEKKFLGLTAVRDMAYSPDQETRKNAYFAELESYKEVEGTCAIALNAIKGEICTVYKMRNFHSPLHMTLIRYRMGDLTLHAMLEIIEDALPSLQKFFRKKAEILGHKNGLPFYDLFAPIGKAEMTFTFDEAKEFIVRHFTQFSERMGKFANRAFNRNWIDAEIRDGKNLDAFCYNIHAIGQSRISINFDGSYRSVKSLAYQLGRAYHGECVKKAPKLRADYTPPTAEIAATFCEAIITNGALKEATEEQKYGILEEELSRGLHLIVDMYSHFVFERAFFDMREEGPISLDTMKELMEEAQKVAYGDSLDPDYLHKYMWINKAEYYDANYNFYNFPYTYGFLFSQSMYNKCKDGGKHFVHDFEEMMLRSGYSRVEKIGDWARLDVRMKGYYRMALGDIQEKIDKFCSM